MVVDGCLRGLLPGNLGNQWKFCLLGGGRPVKGSSGMKKWRF